MSPTTGSAKYQVCEVPGLRSTRSTGIYAPVGPRTVPWRAGRVPGDGEARPAMRSPSAATGPVARPGQARQQVPVRAQSAGGGAVVPPGHHRLHHEPGSRSVRCQHRHRVGGSSGRQSFVVNDHSLQVGTEIQRCSEVEGIEGPKAGRRQLTGSAEGGLARGYERDRVQRVVDGLRMHTEPCAGSPRFGP